MTARFRGRQIVRLQEFASTELNITLLGRALACPFGVDHSAVKRALLRGYEDPPTRGRHPELSPACEAELVEWLTKEAANNTAVTRTEFLQACIERFGQSISRGWVDSFLIRHRDESFETESVPQENPRPEVPRDFLEAAIESFRDHVHNGCAELIFNLDEIGISEWEDKIERHVIVPSAMRGQRIFHGIHWNLKHISAVACISAAGNHMTLFMVCSQFNDSVERLLKTQ
jgi:hypothetical protein